MSMHKCADSEEPLLLILCRCRLRTKIRLLTQLDTSEWVAKGGTTESHEIAHIDPCDPIQR